MRRILIAILSTIYFFTVTGIVITTHLCMGQIASVKINEKDNADACSKCGMHEMESCCTEDEQTFKISSDQKGVELASIILKGPVFTATQSSPEHFYFLSPIHEEVHLSSSPPPKSVPLYIYICVFTV